MDNEPICYCRGEFRPLSQLMIPASDIGFIHGTTVSEQVRTFQSRPFLLDKHIQRWNAGLKTLGLKSPSDNAAIPTVVQRLIDYNAAFLPEGSEQGICFFSTPGQSDFGWGGTPSTDTTLAAYTYPLPVHKQREVYRRGVDLVTTSICDVPSECWPPTIKVRSRLHYYLAQQRAREVSPDSHAILLDQQANVSDSAIASIVGWSASEGLVVRPESKRYASVSVEFLIQLSRRLNIPVAERTFSLSELKSFPEAFLVSTPWCIFPVAQIDQRPMDGRAKGYPTFAKLIRAWESAVECEIL